MGMCGNLAPFPAIQKLRTAPEIAAIYLEQVIKQND